MNSIKISTRLKTAFTAMVVLLVILGSIGLWRSASQRQELNDVLFRRIPITEALNIVVDQVNLQAILVRDMAIFTGDPIKKSAIDKIQKSRVVVDEQYKKLEELINTSKGREILQSMTKLRFVFADAGIKYLNLINEGKTAEALLVLEEKYRPAQMEYQHSIQEQVELQARRALEDGNRAESSAKTLQRDIAIALSIAVVMAIFLAIRITNSIVRPLVYAIDVTNKIAKGDLSGDIIIRSKDEMGKLLLAIRKMQQELINTVSIVRQNAEGVASCSSQIASGNNDLSGRTEQQASALEETAASMEQLGATVQQNADSAHRANHMALSASTVAAQGGEVVAKVIETMKGINDSSKKISDIISVIDGIAFQTNILALNAAVEAARAGEQGRGFAVVAGEVRNLAQRSAEAAKEIKQLIISSVERIEQGSALVDNAGSTMTDIVTSIRKVSDLMGEISAASSEQSAGVGQVGEAITQMDHVTQQNAALVEEMAAAATALNTQAEELVHAVAFFKLNDSIITVSQDRTARVHPFDSLDTQRLT